VRVLVLVDVPLSKPCRRFGLDHRTFADFVHHFYAMGLPKKQITNERIARIHVGKIRFIRLFVKFVTRLLFLEHLGGGWAFVIRRGNFG
jgi:hypothetical protein